MKTIFDYFYTDEERKELLIKTSTPMHIKKGVNPTVIDLCCGAGGFSEGFKQAGFKIILGIDIWQDALNSYRHNHKCDTLCVDIKKIDELPESDIVIGSPPCTTFSSLNTTGKKHDTSIIQHVYKLVKDRPYVFENVVNSEYCFRESFDNSKHYTTKIHAYNFGVPQIRERLFVSSIPLNMIIGKFTPMSTIFNGKLLTTTANTSANGKRWKTMDEACWTLDTWDCLELDKMKLTIEQHKQLMGFPIDYYLYGNRHTQIKQLGNAVCPPVAKAIANSILKNSIEIE